MSMKRKIVSVVIVAVLAMWTSQVFAATQADYAGGSAPKHWHDIDTNWMNAFHHPFDGVEMGLDLRLREVYANNIFSLDKDFGDGATSDPAKGIYAGNWNENHWQRIRSRWSMMWALSSDVSFNTRLTWEFWHICGPDNSFSQPLQDRGSDFREGVFDWFNIKWKNAFDAPMTLVIGRQDIILGTGWLVLDGTPADGSRTIYFDAARATIDLSEKTKLDLIYINQADDEERWLPAINHRQWLHVTQKTDEEGLIAYLTDKSIDNTQLEGYYIYKSERPSNWSQFWNGKNVNWAGSVGKEAEINTFGGRIAQNLGENWSYSVEVAAQFGKRDGKVQKGLGSNNKLAYAFNNDLKNELHLTHEFLSGDNPSTTGTDEKFDTLWGDWPQYQRGGDLQSYLWTYEGALGEVANLHRVGLGHSFKPNKEWTLATDYNLMWADQSASAAAGPYGAPAFQGGSRFRGQMFTVLATYRCCKNFKTEFLVDYFMPGNYYALSSHDNATFARINLEWTF